MLILLSYKLCFWLRLPPYHVESTSSCPITKVKQHWFVLVFWWVTAWEYKMLYIFFWSVFGIFQSFSQFRIEQTTNFECSKLPTCLIHMEVFDVSLVRTKESLLIYIAVIIWACLLPARIYNLKDYKNFYSTGQTTINCIISKCIKQSQTLSNDLWLPPF